jgi:hypothetical protein
MSIATISRCSYTRGKEVDACEGAVYLKITSSEYRDGELIGKITQTAQDVPEVKSIVIDVVSHLVFVD